MKGDFWIAPEAMTAGREWLARSVRAMLDREPEFIPTPLQLDRYKRLGLNPELMSELLARAGLVVCPACKGPGCDACRGRGHVTELFADAWKRQGV